jgi:hypothetical protein
MPGRATPEQLIAAHAEGLAVITRHVPGGIPTGADLQGLRKRVAARFNVPLSDVEMALSTAL